MQFHKQAVKTVPIRIQFHNLDIKYWGQKSHFKITSSIGKPIKIVQAIAKREKWCMLSPY